MGVGTVLGELPPYMPASADMKDSKSTGKLYDMLGIMRRVKSYIDALFII